MSSLHTTVKCLTSCFHPTCNSKLYRKVLTNSPYLAQSFGCTFEHSLIRTGKSGFAFFKVTQCCSMKSLQRRKHHTLLYVRLKLLQVTNFLEIHCVRALMESKTQFTLSQVLHLQKLISAIHLMHKTYKTPTVSSQQLGMPRIHLAKFKIIMERQ